MAHIDKRAYAETFGPTVGDRVRLADTALVIDLRHEPVTGLGEATACIGEQGGDVWGRHGGGIRQLQNLQGARAMRQAAQEAALLEAGDEAMDAGLRLQAKGLFHLVERRRYAVVVQALVDEQQQLVLFAG